MQVSLKLHPECRSAAVSAVDVLVERTGVLTLRYVVTGRIDQILLPPPSATVRADELWRHTCFEAFVRGSACEAYTEFNFSPSTQWGAYRFTGYRRDMQVAPNISAPRIETSAGPHRYELAASVTAAPSGARLGLSAIIEEVDGGKSYWALAHPPGRPDFHHDDSFAYDLR